MQNLGPEIPISKKFRPFWRQNWNLEHPRSLRRKFAAVCR